MKNNFALLLIDIPFTTKNTQSKNQPFGTFYNLYF
mgnify:CR=1 FL=1